MIQRQFSNTLKNGHTKDMEEISYPNTKQIFSQKRRLGLVHHTNESQKTKTKYFRKKEIGTSPSNKGKPNDKN